MYEEISACDSATKATHTGIHTWTDIHIDAGAFLLDLDENLAIPSVLKLFYVTMESSTRSPADEHVEIDEKIAPAPTVDHGVGEILPAENLEKTYYSKLSVWLMILFSGIAIGSDG